MIATAASRAHIIHHLLAGKNGQYLFMIAVGVLIVIGIASFKHPGG